MKAEQTKRCAVAECEDGARVKGMCMRHYVQKRRGRLGRTKEYNLEGDASQVSFRCNEDLKQLIKRLARVERRDPSELWREGAELLLKARAQKGKLS